MDAATVIDLVTGGLTSLGTLASVAIAVRTLKQNNHMIEESTRPVIAIYTEQINTGHQEFYLVVKNFGKSVAHIKSFEYDCDFRGCYKVHNDRDYLKKLNNSILAPGQSRICILDYEKIDREVTFTVHYGSASGKDYIEKCTLDLKSGASMIYARDDTTGKELRSISYTLQEMLQREL